MHQIGLVRQIYYIRYALYKPNDMNALPSEELACSSNLVVTYQQQATEPSVRVGSQSL